MSQYAIFIVNYLLRRALLILKVTFTLSDLVLDCHRVNFILSEIELRFRCLKLIERSLICSCAPSLFLMSPSNIYSKTRLQIIRWNKSREASTENEEKQKGLNLGKRTTRYDRSLTTIILHSMTNLPHPSYYTKQKGQTEKDWTSEK